MSLRARHAVALIGFLLLTLVCTWPIARELGSAVHGPGDPLLNSWIWSWETHALRHLDRIDFFDTNIFYPHRNTLAYSEFLLPQLLVAAPLILITGNSVLAHNVVLLLSILATAFATYLLAFQITRQTYASFAAGIILAFSPFMFSHLAQVQVFFAAGIPLTFLLLDRWLSTTRCRDAALLAVVYAVQVLANAYYAVYLTFFAGLTLLVRVLQSRLWRQRRFWIQAALAAVIAITLIGPFYVRYLELRQEMGFERVLPPPTPASAFLAVSPDNRLYGELSRTLAYPKAYLFPGLVASALSLIGLLQWARRRHFEPVTATETSPPRRVWWRFSLLDGSIVTVATILLLLAIGWRIDTDLGPVHLRIASLGNPALLLAMLLGLRFWMSRRWSDHARPVGLPSSGWTFPLILLSAGILSLGTAPYQFLYRWVPGFSGLRAVPRIYVMFMLALAILAAQGLTWLLEKTPVRRRWFVAIGLSALIVVESLSAPLPMASAPKPEEFPPAHRWLAEQEEDLVFISYPLRIRDNILDLFYSTRHWRQMVNGFSGFLPPLYRELVTKGASYPGPEAIGDLQDLGVDYVLVDLSRYRQRRRQRIAAGLAQMSGLTELAVFDETVVYRLLPGESQAVTTEASATRSLAGPDLTLRSSFEPQFLDRALDGDRRTRWGAPMRSGEWLEVGWEMAATVVGLELEISNFPHDYPRAYRLEASLDGHTWQPISQADPFYPPINDFLRPRDFTLTFDLPSTGAKHLRFVQTGDSDGHTWSVVEVRVLVAAP